MREHDKEELCELCPSLEREFEMLYDGVKLCPHCFDDCVRQSVIDALKDRFDKVDVKSIEPVFEYREGVTHINVVCVLENIEAEMTMPVGWL